MKFEDTFQPIIRSTIVVLFRIFDVAHRCFNIVMSKPVADFEFIKFPVIDFGFDQQGNGAPPSHVIELKIRPDEFSLFVEPLSEFPCCDWFPVFPEEQCVS
ncbi:MAG: hypothetical protein V1726_03015 [Methanobacteriota archaeon]